MEKSELIFPEGFVPFNPEIMTKDEYEINSVYPILVISANEEGTKINQLEPQNSGYPIDDD